MEKVTAYITRGGDGAAQLLVFRDPGHADFGLVVPGGTVQEHERLEEALLREIQEESGFASVRVLGYLGAVEYTGAGGTPVTRHYYHCAVEGPCPEVFTHVVRSQDEDDLWICHYFWLDLDPRRPPRLGGRLGERLDDFWLDTPSGEVPPARGKRRLGHQNLALVHCDHDGRNPPHHRVPAVVGTFAPEVVTVGPELRKDDALLSTTKAPTASCLGLAMPVSRGGAPNSQSSISSPGLAAPRPTVPLERRRGPGGQVATRGRGLSLWREVPPLCGDLERRNLGVQEPPSPGGTIDQLVPPARGRSCVDMKKALLLVRPAMLSDISGISSVCSAGWRATYSGLLPDAYIERTIAEFYSHDRLAREVPRALPWWNGWIVAVQDEVVVGAGGGGMTSPGVGELFVLYVDPARRGRGIGSAVLSVVIEQLVASGATEQWVSVIKGNDKGIPFYLARGFETRGEQPAHGSRPDEGIVSLRLCRTLTAR